MFTGIIEATAEVLERSETGITLARPAAFDDLKNGCSICVSGACLTVISFDNAAISFDVIAETWERTKLGAFQAGDLVNLERAVRVGDRLDGHMVQGHVDAVGMVLEVDGARAGKDAKTPISKTPNNVQIPKFKYERLSIRYPQELRGFIVEKGSIAIDGVSLTVASVDDNQFSIALIPTTLTVTILGSLCEGDRVNLEADIVGRYVRALAP